MQVRARSAIVRMVGSGLTCAVDEQSNGSKGVLGWTTGAALGKFNMILELLEVSTTNFGRVTAFVRLRY